MRFGVLSVIIFAFFLNANAYEYRHMGLNKKTDKFIYVSLGLIAPFSNRTSNYRALGNDKVPVYFSCRPGSCPYNYNPDNNEMTFAKNKIGALVALGYKTETPIRIELKADFTTFRDKYSYQSPVSIQLQDASSLVNVYSIETVVRQIGLVSSLYLDYDNNTPFIPYIGVGGGVTYMQVFLTALDFRDENYSLVNDDDKYKFKGLYELKAGLKIGGKVGYVDIQGYIRKVPNAELTTKGILFQLTFRL